MPNSLIHPPTVLFFATGGTLQRIGCFTMELKDTEMTAPLDREIDELIHQGGYLALT